MVSLRTPSRMLLAIAFLSSIILSKIVRVSKFAFFLFSISLCKSKESKKQFKISLLIRYKNHTCHTIRHILHNGRASWQHINLPEGTSQEIKAACRLRQMPTSPASGKCQPAPQAAFGKSPFGKCRRGVTKVLSPGYAIQNSTARVTLNDIVSSSPSNAFFNRFVASVRLLSKFTTLSISSLKIMA